MKRSLHISGAAELSDAFGLPERRAHPRLRPPSLIYVELDEGNGGIVVNLCEDGMAVQAVMGLMDEFLSRVRFQLSDSKDWIETGAQVVWANETRKLLGLRFVELPEASRQQIRGWLEREHLADQGAEPPGIPAEGSEAPAAEARTVIAMPTPSAPKVSLAPAIVEPPVVAASAIVADLPSPLDPGDASPPFSDSEPHPPSVPAMETGEDVEPVPAVVASKDSAMPGFSYQRDSSPLSAPSEGSADRWGAAIFFLFLATASLVAGWAVGRGALGGGIQAFRKAVLHEGAAGGAVTSRSALIPQSKLSGIEIVDAQNDHWTIPLAAAALPAATAGRPDSTGPFPSTGRAKTAPFRTWVLTAPLQPKTESASSGAAAPPVVAPAVESPQSALPLVEQPYSIPAPPPPKQAVVRRAELIHHVNPDYPPLAALHRVEGVVKMRVTVNANGDVRNIRVLSGPQLLVDAAVRAAGQWFYAPTTVDGKPTDSDLDISISFSLP
jgi:TonB family protein